MSLQAIRQLSTEAELARCFAIVRELRPHLADEAQFLRLTRAALDEGAEVVALEHEGQVVSFALFRIRTMLVSGVTMYVDDLVTAERVRSQGFGKAMLAWLKDYAREHGCETFSLDSATWRHDAHAFYFRERLRITAFHFQQKL